MTLSLSWAATRMQMLFSVVEKAGEEVFLQARSRATLLPEAEFVASSVVSRAVSVLHMKMSDCCFWMLKPPPPPHFRNSLAESNKICSQELELAAYNGSFPLGFCQSLQHNPWRPGPACDLWCFSQYRQSGAARGRWEGADAVGAQEGVHPRFPASPPTHRCWLPGMWPCICVWQWSHDLENSRYRVSLAGKQQVCEEKNLSPVSTAVVPSLH